MINLIKIKRLLSNCFEERFKKPITIMVSIQVNVKEYQILLDSSVIHYAHSSFSFVNKWLCQFTTQKVCSYIKILIHYRKINNPSVRIKTYCRCTFEDSKIDLVGSQIKYKTNELFDCSLCRYCISNTLQMALNQLF